MVNDYGQSVDEEGFAEFQAVSSEARSEFPLCHRISRCKGSFDCAQNDT